MKTIMNFILKIFELLKSDPEIAMSKYLIGAGLVSNGIGSIVYYYKIIPHNICCHIQVDLTLLDIF